VFPSIPKSRDEWVVAHKNARAELLRAGVEARRLPKKGRRALSALELRGAHIEGLILCEEELRGADLRGTFFHRVALQMCFLQGSDLRGCSFSESLLLDQFFEGADLRGVHFYGCVIRENDFTGADFRGACFDDGYFECLRDLSTNDFTGVAFGRSNRYIRESVGDGELLTQLDGKNNYCLREAGCEEHQIAALHSAGIVRLGHLVRCGLDELVGIVGIDRQVVSSIDRKLRSSDPRMHLSMSEEETINWKEEDAIDLSLL